MVDLTIPETGKLTFVFDRLFLDATESTPSSPGRDTKLNTKTLLRAIVP